MPRPFLKPLVPAPALPIDLTIPDAIEIHDTDSEPDCIVTETEEDNNETQTQIETVEPQTQGLHCKPKIA